MRRWLWVAGVAAGLGCGGDGGPGPSTRRSCSQLGWVCGLDDYGSSCGSCGSGRACNYGTCVTAGCTPSCGGRTCGTESTCRSSCGTCGSGETCTAEGTCITPMVTPTAHSVADGATGGFPYYFGVPFTVPASRVGYSVNSPSGDGFTVGIFTEVNWAIYSNGGTGAVAYASHGPVTSFADAATVPAGTYYLGFRCTNLIENCSIRYAIAATY